MRVLLALCISMAAFFAANANIGIPDETAASLRELFQIFGKLGSPNQVRSVFEKEMNAGRLSILKFSWNDCGGPSFPAKVEEITITPDPMRLPGNVSISFKGHLDVSLSTPLQLSVAIEKKVIVWIKVPCMGQFGSCNYDDVCTLLPLIKCPPPFQKYGIPCQCPINKGEYKLPASEFFIDDSFIPSILADGHYRATAHLRKDGQDIACVHIEFAIAKP